MTEIDEWKEKNGGVEYLNTPPGDGKVLCILLETEKGVVGYRPTRHVEEYKEIHGNLLRCRKQELVTLDELPLALNNLNEILLAARGKGRRQFR